MTDLPAGRALDALVAEKVMGWVWAKNTHHASGATSYDLILKDEVYSGLIVLEKPDIEADYKGPEFSTDLAAAWRVVEHAPGLFHVLQYKEGWLVTIYNPKTSEMWQGDAPTAPLAICRAALQAVEG